MLSIEPAYPPVIWWSGKPNNKKENNA